MVVTAIAGGATRVGLYIIKAILNTKKHKVILLSRSKQPDLAKLEIDIRIVDYGSIQELKRALAGVHTVISCISPYGADSTSAELNLLQGSKEAGVVRFVPSEWAADCHDIVDLYSKKEIVWQAVQSSGLEYTRFINGLWMNVWGPGCIKDEKEALAGYEGPAFAIDLRAGTATFPGDGSHKVVLTTIKDIGRFVAASLELPKWQPESRIVGDRLSFIDVAHLAKEICGIDLRITHISSEEILAALEDKHSASERFYYQLLLSIAIGRLDFESTLNDMCQDIRPLSVADYLKRHWTSI